MRYNQKFWDYCDRVYLRHPHNFGQIAQDVIAHFFQPAFDNLNELGMGPVLQSGLRERIKRRYAARSEELGIAQYDFADIDNAFEASVKELGKSRYFVESLDGHYSVPFLIKHPRHLDDAVRYLDRKGDETKAEAKRLKRLLDVVLAQEAAA